MAAERNEVKNEVKRDAFRKAVELLGGSADAAADELVFLDEAGFSLSMSVLYGWGRKGEPLTESVSAKRGKNLSVLGALDKEGMVAVTQKLGAMKRVDVERFLRVDLLPRLEPGAILVLDNATIHKGGRIESIIKKAGCRLLYLPPYSPDFNPIELAWAFLKKIVRKRGPRDDKARLRAVNEAVNEAVNAIPADFAQACFGHCHYLQPF